MDFLTTLTTVAFMLIYAIPGVIMMKAKMVSEETIRSISKIMMYVCQPCFAVYSFNRLDFSWKFLAQVLIFMAVIIILQIIIILILKTVYKKRFENVKYRMCTLASCFGNCVFFGAPVLEVLLPEFPEAIVFANAYAVAMNILGWTLGSAIITNDRKYMSARKVIFNPGTIGFVLAILFYCVNLKFGDGLLNSLSLLGKMTTPLSMMVLGMRLATVDIKPIFATPVFYFTILVKQMLYPLVGTALMSVIPLMSGDIITTTFILCACPVASIVFNFAELLGDGQEHAADLFLLGTISSVITMPIILLIL